ncbi:hypothetical protein BGX26_005712, partial [Mortierella sp. AD094]
MEDILDRFDKDDQDAIQQQISEYDDMVRESSTLPVWKKDELNKFDIPPRDIEALLGRGWIKDDDGITVDSSSQEFIHTAYQAMDHIYTVYKNSDFRMATSLNPHAKFFLLIQAPRRSPLIVFRVVLPAKLRSMGQANSHDLAGYRIAPEWEPHQSTIMSWPTKWEGLNYKVQQDVSRVAQAVSMFEYVQVLVPPNCVGDAKKLLGDGIGIISTPVDDLWARDTSPLFLSKGDDLVGVTYNFNGWGRKAPYKNDARVANKLLDYFDLPGFKSKLVAEGGSIETDGQGTLLMTESSIVNKNRNPGKSRDQIEKIFKSELDIKKIIWVKGVKGHDITDSHIDSLARFVAPGVVMVSRPALVEKGDTESLVWAKQYEQALQVLKSSTDAMGNKLKIIELPEPNPEKIREISPELAKLCKDIDLDCKDGGLTSYLNFYIANGGIVMPEFGDVEADHKAQQIVQAAFPDRKVVAVNIDFIAQGGGGIHCATHDIPFV